MGGETTPQDVANKRRAFAEQVFADYPGRISPEMQKSILKQEVVTGMNPYEAYLAAGQFAFKVVPDLSKWKANEDPFRIIWAQATEPDASQIWMTFENESQFLNEGRTRFRVFFEQGKARHIERVRDGDER